MVENTNIYLFFCVLTPRIVQPTKIKFIVSLVSLSIIHIKRLWLILYSKLLSLLI